VWEVRRGARIRLQEQAKEPLLTRQLARSKERGGRSLNLDAARKQEHEDDISEPCTASSLHDSPRVARFGAVWQLSWMYPGA
jgi:hypothetical protein